jgi:mitochondrial fission protein ELM1
MRTQARGLAVAVTPRVEEKLVIIKRPWRWLPAGWPGVLAGVEPQPGYSLAPPWPDLIVTCGRRGGIVGLAVKQKAGGRPLLVHVQDPLASLKHFDLVVAMEHDDVRGPKVLRVLTTMHDMTPERLAAAAGQWRERFAHLPRPLVGVLLGGPTRHTDFGPPEAAELLRRLSALRAKTGGGAAVVPSRRTPDEVLAVFQAAAKDDPGLWVWDRDGDNPYLGVLALADRLVITSDSISMISEALATMHPIEIFAGNIRRRHEGFVETLVDHGQARLFDGEVAPPLARRLVDATGEAAAAVKALLAKKGFG